MTEKAIIALEDGSLFEGRAFAGHGEIFGELVFNTSMSGYQEILTDPSYHEQIVTFTYPLIGNYGINPEDVESQSVRPAGIVIGEYSRIPSNWRCRMTLKDYLEQSGRLGVHEVDTRAITLHIRSRGAMKCVISTTDLDRSSLVRKANDWPGFIGRDIASEVSTTQRYQWPGPHKDHQGFSSIGEDNLKAYDKYFGRTADAPRFRVAVLDCGLKANQLRLMARLGCELEVFPMGTPAGDILATKPHGFFISNGPGDPAAVPDVVSNIRKIAESGLPTFGICFGHQLLGQAFGGKTYKLKFGHRGGNQPVKDLTTGKVEITSQNHGFAVDLESLPETVETTHINLNDNTSEGLRHKTLPAFSVQYHPEACPGPHDSTYLFERFMKLMEKGEHE